MPDLLIILFFYKILYLSTQRVGFKRGAVFLLSSGKIAAMLLSRTCERKGPEKWMMVAFTLAKNARIGGRAAALLATKFKRCATHQ